MGCGASTLGSKPTATRSLANGINNDLVKHKNQYEKLVYLQHLNLYGDLQHLNLRRAT